MKDHKKTAFINILTVAALVALLAAAALAAPPANDNFNTAEVIGGVSGTVSGTNTEATTQPCEPSFSIQSFQSVWYKWTAPETRSYTFKIDTSTSSTTVSAFSMISGFCQTVPGLVPTSLIDENESYNSFLNGQGQISFRAVAGVTYYVRVSPPFQSAPVQNNFTLKWEKTKIKYYTTYDENNSYGDLLVARSENTKLMWYGLSNLNEGIRKHVFLQWGVPGDIPLTGDYDGDGKTDAAAVRNQNGKLVWWITKVNGTPLRSLQFGLAATDTPIVGDFDGDGIADIAVTRDENAGSSGSPRTWHVLRSSDNQYVGFQFGLDSDRAWVGDYDGDGKSDQVAIRRGTDNKLTWFILFSESSTYAVKQYGQYGDYPQAADFDADGKTDLCVFRQHDFTGGNQAGNWYFVKSSFGINSQINIVKFGQTGDQPQALSMNGINSTSFAVFRAETGEWWIADTMFFGVRRHVWGLSGDTALSSTNAYDYAYLGY